MVQLKPWLNDLAVPTSRGIEALLKRNKFAYVAAQVLLKGLEIDLPDGFSFRDKDGIDRRKARIAWWRESARTYHEATISPIAEELDGLPNLPLPKSVGLVDQDPRPVFFGHYWLKGTPTLFAANKACLDYSLTGDQPLCCYSWCGEANLTLDHFITTGGEAPVSLDASMHQDHSPQRIQGPQLRGPSLF